MPGVSALSTVELPVPREIIESPMELANIFRPDSTIWAPQDSSELVAAFTGCANIKANRRIHITDVLFLNIFSTSLTFIIKSCPIFFEQVYVSKRHMCHV